MSDVTDRYDAYTYLLEAGFSRSLIQNWIWCHVPAADTEALQALAGLHKSLHNHVPDAAAWFEMPLVEGYWLTPEVLIKERQEPAIVHALVAAIVEGRGNGLGLLLEMYVPGWQRTYERDGLWETFREPDGSLGIRARSDQGKA